MIRNVIMKYLFSFSLLTVMLAAVASPAPPRINVATAASNSNGISWTMGQLAATTSVSADNTVFMTQGFLQSPVVDKSFIDEVSVQPGFRIEFDGCKVRILADGSIKWSVFDLHGRTVRSGNSAEINLGDFPAGVYVIRAEHRETILTQKLMKH